MSRNRDWSRLISTLLLLLLLLGAIDSAEIKTRSKELTLPSSQMFQHAFHTRSNLWYLACEREPTRRCAKPCGPAGEREPSDNAVDAECGAGNATCEQAADVATRNCSVVMVPNLFDNRRNFEKRCAVELRPELAGGRVGAQMFLRLFNELTVLVQWAEREANATRGRRRASLRFTIVHLFEECRTVKVRVDGEEEADDGAGSLAARSDLFIQGRTFSVLYPEPGLCRGNKCKLTFDTEGRVLSGPLPWLLSAANDVVRVYRIPTRGYHWLTTLVDRSDGSNSTKVLLVDALGSSTTLQSTGADNDWIQVSTANGYLGWCWRDAAASLLCSQYDAFGVRLFENVRVAVGQPVGFARPYNLPWGGLLLAVAERTRNQNRHYHVLRLHRDGRLAALLEFSTPGCDAPRYKLYSREDNVHEFCLEVECYSENYYDLIMHSFYDLLPESLERETNKRYSK